MLKGRDWDVVIDDSGYFPRRCRRPPTCSRTTSSTTSSCRASPRTPTSRRPASTRTTSSRSSTDPNAKEITEENYGGLKAACEQIVEQTFGARQAVIRPTYIVGPGDHTDRFTYWPVRVARGGEMLAPGTPTDPIQFIDVRDLAEFMRLCVEQRIAGRYNLCNPPGAVTMGDLLDTSKRVTRPNTTFLWAA